MNDYHETCDFASNKLDPGQYGYGNIDTDTDRNGTDECHHGHPNGVSKTV